MDETCHYLDDLPSDFTPLRLHLLPEDRRITVAEPTFVVGRHSGADLRLHSTDVSRHHCRFAFREGGWHLADLDSLNGVFLNGARTFAAPLADGDRIVVGPVTLIVTLKMTPNPKVEVLKRIAEALPRRVA